MNVKEMMGQTGLDDNKTIILYKFQHVEVPFDPSFLFAFITVITFNILD